MLEVRKSDGTQYPPQSIHLILCGLQRYIRRNNAHPIFDKSDVLFRGLRGTMESMHQNVQVQHVFDNSRRRGEAVGEQNPWRSPTRSSPAYGVLLKWKKSLSAWGTRAPRFKVISICERGESLEIHRKRFKEFSWGSWRSSTRRSCNSTLVLS